jgi:hypothetical protein
MKSLGTSCPVHEKLGYHILLGGNSVICSGSDTFSYGSRNHGYVPLGYGYGSCSVLQWLSRCKLNYWIFLLVTYNGCIYISLQR